MKNILISFIRNNHLETQKDGISEDIDISKVVKSKSIDRLFLLTNQDRDESISFKNWISDKLDIEVKAVTLEKGSEKYILNKIESIIKYILLAEEGHARFFYLPGENTLQINIWEIVHKNIYKGEIIYPDNLDGSRKKKVTSEVTKIPIYTNPEEKKIFTVKVNQPKPLINNLGKGAKAIENGMNLLICGEEGAGKHTLAKRILKSCNLPYSEINFRAINPSKMDEEFAIILKEIEKKENNYFLFLNIEVLPYHIQEKFTEQNGIQIIATMNIKDPSALNDLNRKFYYHVSNSILSLEPLRSQKEILPTLVSEIIHLNNSKAVLSEHALEYLKRHNWPGNINELNSVISRACVETDSIITAEIIEKSIDHLENDLMQWLSDPIDENFKLNDVLGDVAMHYIMLALEKSEGKKSTAARMLGFSNYQTLGNWIRKYKK